MLPQTGSSLPADSTAGMCAGVEGSRGDVLTPDNPLFALHLEQMLLVPATSRSTCTQPQMKLRELRNSALSPEMPTNFLPESQLEALPLLPFFLLSLPTVTGRLSVASVKAPT